MLLADIRLGIEIEPCQQRRGGSAADDARRLRSGLLGIEVLEGVFEQPFGVCIDLFGFAAALGGLRQVSEDRECPEEVESAQVEIADQRVELVDVVGLVLFGEAQRGIVEPFEVRAALDGQGDAHGRTAPRVADRRFVGCPVMAVQPDEVSAVVPVLAACGHRHLVGSHLLQVPAARRTLADVVPEQVGEGPVEHFVDVLLGSEECSGSRFAVPLVFERASRKKQADGCRKDAYLGFYGI